MYIFPKLQSVMLPFTYVCFWKCCTPIKALFFLLTKFHNTKLRTVPHGTVCKVRLVRTFITRTNVPYPYLSNNYVPYKRTVLLAEKWSVPYRTCVTYRTVLPSLVDRPLAQLLSAHYRCRGSGVQFPGRSNRHSVANDSPPLQRFYGAV